jgi:hypothetical protein
MNFSRGPSKSFGLKPGLKISKLAPWARIYTKSYRIMVQILATNSTETATKRLTLRKRISSWWHIDVTSLQCCFINHSSVPRIFDALCVYVCARVLEMSCWPSRTRAVETQGQICFVRPSAELASRYPISLPESQVNCLCSQLIVSLLYTI